MTIKHHSCEIKIYNVLFEFLIKTSILFVAAITVLGCQSEIQRKTTENLAKVMENKRNVRKAVTEEPTVSEQFKREIHSQSEPQHERRFFRFKG